MALPANWHFGGRNPLEGVLSPFGGFNLGNIQPVGPFNAPPSTVSTPTAGVSGTPAGQPSVGMDAMRTPFSQPTDAGAADGSGPGPAASGPGFSVGEAASTAARGGSFGTGLPSLPGLVDSSVPGLVSGAGKVASLLGFANPLTMAALPFSLTNSLTGLVANNMVDPASNTPVANISPNAPADPQFSGSEGFAGTAAPATGLPSTAIGRAIAAIIDSNPPTGSMGGFGFGSNGSTIDANGTISNSLGTQTGQSLFRGGDPDATTGEAGPVGIGEGAAPGTPGGIGAAVGTSGVAAGIGTPGEPGGPSGPGTAGTTGEGDGGGTGGGTGGGDGGGASGGGDGAMRKGGRVAKRPDPRKLADMLKSGARVPVGNPRSKTDDVPVVLQRNEEVMNRNATKAHGKTLDRWNAEGNRRAGGMAVRGVR
jgi:hypothetical protein